MNENILYTSAIDDALHMLDLDWAEHRADRFDCLDDVDELVARRGFVSGRSVA